MSLFSILIAEAETMDSLCVATFISAYTLILMRYATLPTILWACFLLWFIVFLPCFHLFCWRVFVSEVIGKWVSKEYLLHVVLPVKYYHNRTFPSTTTSCYTLIPFKFHLHYAICCPMQMDYTWMVFFIQQDSDGHTAMTRVTHSASMIEYHLGAIMQYIFHWIHIL